MFQSAGRARPARQQDKLQDQRGFDPIPQHLPSTRPATADDSKYGSRDSRGGAAAAPAAPTTDVAWGDGALCSSIKLQPGEEKEIRFRPSSWHFPNHISRRGGSPVLGHIFKKLVCRRRGGKPVSGAKLPGAIEKNRGLRPHVLRHHAGQRHALRLDGPNDHPDQVQLVAQGWQVRHLGGLGLLRIPHDGHHLPRLLPHPGAVPQTATRPDGDGGQFPRANGQIPHFFTPDLSAVDRGFDRVDMNPQFVMLVCRDYLWTGDKECAQTLAGHRPGHELDGPSGRQRRRPAGP